MSERRIISRGELAEMLKGALEEQDSDAIWFVIGELERGDE